MYSVLVLYLSEDGGIEVFDKWVTDFLTGEKDMATKFYQFDDIELRQWVDRVYDTREDFYDGDILDDAGDIEVVRWDKSKASFFLYDVSEKFRELGIDELDIHAKVIGNVYEHPEMLKEKWWE
jgi:hypothetical protein